MAQPVELRASTNDQEALADAYGLKVNLTDKTTGSAVALTGSFYNMTGSETKVVKSGAGVLFAVIVNNPGTTQTLTLYDNTAASGTKIATISLAAGQSFPYGLAFGTGLTAVLSGTADVTIVYA